MNAAPMESWRKSRTQTRVRSRRTVQGKSMPSGGGGLFSTIGDYARFGQMLLNDGRFDGKQFLGRKTIELMRVNHLSHLDPPKINPEPLGFGLGGSVVTDLAKTGAPGSIGTFGWGGYATTSVEMDSKEKCLFLFFFQHLPYDQDGILGKCSRLAYQALVD
ncbi:MAG: class C beta-lactamase-related serine hydrolase [Pedosphaera sp.]|nr:class C beta-lactamase-related serine hydrolase [Pedosphaera sp.]